MERIPHIPCLLKSISFGIYRTSEIENLSVQVISNPEILDEFGNPLPNGLHDSHLGSIKEEDICDTCGLGGNFCPGHFGHIVLPLPVFNPVLTKTLYQLLQGTCFDCHHIRASSFDNQLFFHQLNVLDYGLIDIAEDLLTIAVKSKKDKEPEDIIRRRLQDFVNKATNGLNLELCKSRANVKSVVECRERIRNNFLKTLVTSSTKVCPHCYGKSSKLIKNSKGLCHEYYFLFYENESKDENPSNTSLSSISITPEDIKNHLNLVWEIDSTLLKCLFGCLTTPESTSDCPMDKFFIEMLMVPPSRFRPMIIMEDKNYLNPQTIALRNVLIDVCLLNNLMKSITNESVPDTKIKFYSISGKTYKGKFNYVWYQLQTHVNCIYDNDTERRFCGVKQILETKEGLFREHMMGKRVNFAARTVITPNPFLNVDEIGVPEMFAKKLTYPARLTNYNAGKLRRAVINGPDFHPGANKIETEDGRIINLYAMDPSQRWNYACSRLTSNSSSKKFKKNGPIIIHRHLENGDIVLMNRQPTLHRPSIMAHKVRVLPGAGKTFQFHYANCKAYNADFDGDEMNLHFPQNELGRSEAASILNVSRQYLCPKDGSPLSGLIQDHIVAGTILTMRGRFFNRDEYQQLVYDSVAFLKKPIKTLPPSILKPCILWSGKQIISTIVMNVIPEGLPLPTIEGNAQITSKNWQNAPSREWKAGGIPLIHDDMTESEVIIRSGELLCGVIDKAHIGPTPYSLMHCCFELYGGETSTALLTSLSRLFTNFLQIHRGFTLSIDDFRLTKKADEERQKAMDTVDKNIDKVVAQIFDVDDPRNKAEVKRKFKEAHVIKDDVMLKTVHFELRKFTDGYSERKNQICIHDGLFRKFPKNNFQLMVKSGSKGSFVNAVQISSGLGQIELQGCGVPLMLNGNTLPSYLPYITSPEARGFAVGSFLTGLCSQEFFFHCIAGREGLIDIAVKTSETGYLQRSLIKHLEGLMVNYDQTVRDSDGSVIQFLYGEDGLDVTKVQMLKKGKLHLLANNYAATQNETEVEVLKAQQVLPASGRALRPINHHSKLSTCLPKEDFIYERIITSVLKQDLCCLYFDAKKSALESRKRNIDPINTIFQPGATFGSISEKLDDIIEDYIKTYYVQSICDENSSSKTEKFKDAVNFLGLCCHRALKGAVPPGEAVGLLAAQSIGEPSTQMTLNTFHFAGLSDMNVTLGVPRLKEILMHASVSIKTPTMEAPLLNKPDVEKGAEELCLKLSPVYLNQVLKSVDIEETLHVIKQSQRFRKYSIKMMFLQLADYKDVLYTSPSHILKYIENYFIPNIINIAKNCSSKKSKRRLSKNRLSAGEGSDDETICSIGINESLEVEFDESGDGEQMSFVGTVQACGGNDATNMVPNDSLTCDDFSCESDDSSFEFEKLRSAVAKRKKRESNVVNKCNWVSSYQYSPSHECWCKFELQIPLEMGKINLKTIIEDEANSSELHCVPNVKNAFLVENLTSKNKENILKTDGVNFSEIARYDNIIDMKKIYSNDIHAIAKTYGIEAATRVIVKEITNVFTTYGITVDLRHLLLIADYMTFNGTIKAFNRFGIKNNASPLQKMSFETTVNFLENAIVSGSKDQLKSPSAKIIVGQPIAMGTACFDVLCENRMRTS